MTESRRILVEGRGRGAKHDKLFEWKRVWGTGISHQNMVKGQQLPHRANVGDMIDEGKKERYQRTLSFTRGWLRWCYVFLSLSLSFSSLSLVCDVTTFSLLEETHSFMSRITVWWKQVFSIHWCWWNAHTLAHMEITHGKGLNIKLEHVGDGRLFTFLLRFSQISQYFIKCVSLFQAGLPFSNNKSSLQCSSHNEITI